jgi:hypothetical protein
MLNDTDGDREAGYARFAEAECFQPRAGVEVDTVRGKVIDVERLIALTEPSFDLESSGARPAVKVRGASIGHKAMNITLVNSGIDTPY